jgi:predicted permease
LILGKIIGVFALVFVGFGANKIGWLPLDSGKYISKIVINIAAPCVVVSAMCEQSPDASTPRTFLLISGLGIAQYVIVALLAILICKLMKIPEADKGIYKNFIIFTNNGFMGFPITLVLFGTAGMFYMVVLNCLFNVALFTLGIFNLRSKREPGHSRMDSVKQSLKEILNPLTVSFVVGFLILFLHIPVHVEVKAILDAIGSMMTPLSMMVVGLQLAESRPREIIGNYKLVIMSALRLVVIPGFFFLLLLPFGFDRLLSGTLLLNVLLPCAAMVVVLAEEYGRNAKLAAEGVFLSTLLSMITLPIASILFTML